MEASAPTKEIAATYEPNNAQLARVAALRRFNWLTIYAPVTLLCLTAVTLVILLLWGVLSPNIRGAREFASGVADIVIILTILPGLLLCAIGPAGGIALVALYWRRREERTGSHGRLQTAFWRVDDLMDRIISRLNEILPKVANPFIEGNARAAYLRALLKRAKIIRS